VGISNNGAEEADKDITVKFQKDLRNTVNDCKTIRSTDNKTRYVNLNPNTPVPRGLVKIHKIDTHIRPVVNFRNAPS
jgi:hypothetical protein